MSKSKDNNIAKNRKAYHDYEIIRKMEAGIVLTGNEIKSVHAREINLKDSFVKINYQNEVFLHNAYISPYDKAHKVSQLDPRRARKLLLHKKEIKKLTEETREQGLTIVPLSMYYKGNNVKVQIGLARGKKNYDKRNALKEKSLQMEMKKQNKYY